MNQNVKEAFPIRTVAALTGINPITLRTWERRYGLIAPIRTPKGHRLYTKEQITMLHRVVALVDSGTPISQVNFSLLTSDPEKRTSQEEEFWGRLIARMVAAISRFEEAVLENTYNEALAIYPIETVTQRLLLPMLQVLGDRWASGQGMVAEEHFFGVYLRNKLGARFHHRKKLDHGPLLLTACLPGERHEAGILLFALGAQDHGYRTILLGSDMPLDEMPRTAKQSGCDAIVLAASYCEEPDKLISAIRILVQSTDVPVFIGGLVSENHSDSLIAAGAIPLGSDIGYSFRHIGDALTQPARANASH